MTHRCPTCMANLTDVSGPWCPECGASLREGYDDEPGAVFAWDEPVPVTFNDLTPDPPDELWDTAPKCLCSHSPANHSATTGKCWSLACGCTAVRFREAS